MLTPEQASTIARSRRLAPAALAARLAHDEHITRDRAARIYGIEPREVDAAYVALGYPPRIRT